MYDLLDRLGIAYARADHDPAMTIADCGAVDRLLGVAMCKTCSCATRSARRSTCCCCRGPSRFARRTSRARSARRACPLPTRRTWRNIGHPARRGVRHGADERPWRPRPPAHRPRGDKRAVRRLPSVREHVEPAHPHGGPARAVFCRTWGTRRRSSRSEAGGFLRGRGQGAPSRGNHLERAAVCGQGAPENGGSMRETNGWMRRGGTPACASMQRCSWRWGSTFSRGSRW